jgi:DNA polymerase-1
MPEPIILIDGYAHIYRTFYAIRELSNARGEPTNALYGMIRLLMKIDQEMPSSLGAVVLDKGRCTRRLAIRPEYKGTRKPMPDPLRQQVPLIREAVSWLGWPMLQWEGREADDLIAGIVSTRGEHPVRILSGDKDLAQLVDADVTLVTPGGKGAWTNLGPEDVNAKFGVPPTAVRDYLALVGDSSDNIIGVPGVGAKTAAKLLNEFGSIDGILANLDSIAAKRTREALAGSADLLRANRELTSLDRELPDEWDGLASLKRRNPDWQALLDNAIDNGFKSLVPVLEKRLDDFRNPSLF